MSALASPGHVGPSTGFTSQPLLQSLDVPGIPTLGQSHLPRACQLQARPVPLSLSQHCTTAAARPQGPHSGKGECIKPGTRSCSTSSPRRELGVGVGPLQSPGPLSASWSLPTHPHLGSEPCLESGTQSQAAKPKRLPCHPAIYYRESCAIGQAVLH
jgi:hypothetical protein